MDPQAFGFFVTLVPLEISKNDFTIIWISSKNMNFPKIWRLWLKNCARHTHFSFEFLKGMAVLFFEIYPWNFDQLWILYRQKNDINIICLPINDLGLTKILRAWLKNWGCHALENFKIEMGVAGTVFEPQSPNFVKIHIFWKSSNDSKTIFDYI